MLKKITRKSLLNESKVEYANYAINHVEGCSHGCNFPCYAMTAKMRRDHITREDWLQPKIVANALELLEEEIPRKKHLVETVHLCFTTDPFMYKQREVRELTLKIIKRLNRDDMKCTVLTKGVYPMELIDKETYGSNNEYGITLVSLDKKFKKDFEPGTAPYLDRIKTLRALHDAGLKTWVSMEPYPTPNLVIQDLLEILESIKFVDRIIFGKLNYNAAIGLYPHQIAFYNYCSKRVIEFCEKNNIEYLIKRGTMRFSGSREIMA